MKLFATRSLVFVFLAIGFAAPCALSQSYQVLYSFAGGRDGSSPSGWLTTDDSGNFFGVTADGGAAQNCPSVYSFGCGSIFQFTPSGSESVVHRFNDGIGGGFPNAGLTLAPNGEYYGSAGLGSGASMGGVVYKFNPKTGQTVNMYAFSGGSDGGGPNGVIAGSGGALYGVTTGGGNLTNPSCQSGGCGVVFEISGIGHEKVLHTFTGSPDGWSPRGSLVEDSQGNLYGTTDGGGAGTCNCGTIYKIDAEGNETILHSFSNSPDGALPTQGLMLDSQGNLYGATWAGGAYENGTVFKLDPTGNLTILHSFSGADGANPSSSFIRDSAGNLYGFTYGGGDLSCGFEGSGCGTVFRLDPSGRVTILHSFTAEGSDGLEPFSGHLMLDAAGNLYGVTAFGGSDANGTVFEITR